jgi:hypothetical protein
LATVALAVVLPPLPLVMPPPAAWPPLSEEFALSSLDAHAGNISMAIKTCMTVFVWLGMVRVILV